MWNSEDAESWRFRVSLIIMSALTIIMLTCPHRNVNVFGLAFIIAVSLFFAILDIALLKFLIFLTSFREALSPRLDRWIQDGVLQLQRRAYEAEGQGTWSHVDQDVPLTEPKEMLTSLPLRSLSFPMTEVDDSSTLSKS